MTALMLAAKSGVPEPFELLLMNGADLLAKDKDGRTSLHLSIEKGHHVITKALLVHEELLNSKDRHHNSPIHLAAIRSDQVLVRMLLDQPNLKICTNKQGMLPSAMTSNNFVKAALEKREMQQRGQNGMIANLQEQQIDDEDEISSDSESEGEEIYERLRRNRLDERKPKENHLWNNMNEKIRKMRCMRPTIIGPESIENVITQTRR